MLFNEIITSCLHAEKEIINVFKKIILVEQQKDKDSQMHNILSPFYQQCLNLLSDNKAIGRILCRIVYFCFNTPITRSTWIRTTDNSRLQSTFTFSNCFLPLVKGGVSISAIAIRAYSSQVNPLSAKMISPTKKLQSQKPSTLYQYTYQEEDAVGEMTAQQFVCLTSVHQHTPIYMILCLEELSQSKTLLLSDVCSYSTLTHVQVNLMDALWRFRYSWCMYSKSISYVFIKQIKT